MKLTRTEEPIRRRRSLVVTGLVTALVIVAAGGTGSGVAAAAEHARGVTITSLPSPIAQGGLQHFNASVSERSGKCSLTVRYANGKKQALGRKPVLGGRVAWQWQVPRTAAVGTAKAHVSCPGVGASTGTFKVARPAKVVITQSGFTEHTIDGSGTTISYGLALVNRSPVDVNGIFIEVTLLDAAGHVIDRFAHGFPGRIGTGATFYAGGYAFANETVARIAFSVQAEIAPRLSGLAPPAVTNLQVSTAPDGSVRIDGDIANEATKNLSSASELEAAFFNKAGEIVGGTDAPLSVELPPGTQAPFELTSLPVPQASDVSQVKFDVAPHYANY